ncbi:unnamed protein product [Linum tenue]|uniref:Zinc-ribbon domain-containing protein n=1 Tax=Linum tenue TaxID=586396 RepID=A0AAV0NKX4_9ROSI|nr:unnamed protein product [Linum tenue]
MAGVGDGAGTSNGGIPPPAAAAAPKIRLVRCPRCRQVLPELPNVPVYQCGGCGTHLQAKIRPPIGENSPPASSNGSSVKAASVSAQLNTSASSSSSSSVPSHVVEASSSSGSGETSLDSPVGLKDSTFFNPLNDDQKPETKASNGSVREEIDEKECGDQLLPRVDSDFSMEDQVVKKEKMDHGESSDRDAFIEKEEMFPDVGVDSEHEVDEGGEIAKVDDINSSPLDSRRSNMENAKGDSPLDSRRLSTEKIGDATTESTSTTITAGSPAPREYISEDIHSGLPPRDQQQLNRLQERVRHGIDNRRRYVAEDKFEASDDFINNISSELSEVLVDFSKSPTTRSTRAYYEGFSSYEGTDHDQMPGGRYRPHYRNPYGYNPGNYNNIAEEREDENHNVHRSRNVGMQQYQQQQNYYSPDMNQYLERDELMLQQPLHTRGYMNGYGSGSSPNHLQSGFHGNSNFHPPINPVDIEQEKIRLLRMVYELEDRLTRSCSLNDKVSSGSVSAGGAWSDQQVPRPYREASSWSQPQTRQQHSRIPFSAEATTNGSRHKVDHSFCSTHCNNHNRVFCRSHSGANFCNSYGSCPSTPQRHMGFDDQRPNRDHDLRKYHLANKKHLRPVAGGAPFLACPRCLSQLQLPADFLVSKRKCHPLRCGSCSEVLRFSLVDRTRLVPYSPTANASSASFKQGGQRKRVISDKQGKDPVEAYDDVGHSNGKGGKEKKSTEVEEIEERGGSPLHRLMGYSTLSAVLVSTGARV